MSQRMSLGVTESRDTSNRVYLNLRTGKLSEVSKDEKPGFREYTTENASGTRYTFFAKTYDDLTAYIKKISWNEREWEGKKIIGWSIELDTGDGKEWFLQINSGDRPYQTIMQLLPNVDFNEPVRIIAFMGQDQKTKKDQKVLLLTQNPDRTAKEWVKAKYQPKWLSSILLDKIKAKVPLSDEEKANLDYNSDGSINKEYPYIKQGRDSKWQFDAWTDFLIDRMNEDVIPAVDLATENRGETTIEEISDYTGTSTYGSHEPPPFDDEIPF